jgi:hypothetical protein
LKIQELDQNRLGQLLSRIPLASMQAHHKKVSSTMRDYILPTEDDLEAQYVRDLFVLTTDEIINKWFDGEESAADLLFRR